MADAHTAILMGTYNGEKFLAQQLSSILQQSLNSWSLWISDDGSTDETALLLKRYQDIHKDRLHILKGPRHGFVRNFLSLACNPSIQAHYFAYADQDDIWLPDKLLQAVRILARSPDTVPTLYCSRTMIIDESGAERGYSLLDSAQPSFANALIQNIASGNTMVFNAAARDLLLAAGPDVDVFAHDWWTYLAVMAVDGIVIFDPVPLVQYRQHGDNQVGATLTLSALLRRTRLDRNGHLRSTFRRNIVALNRLRHLITPDNRALLDRVHELNHTNPIRRLLAFLRLPFKRQRFLGNCSLGLAILLGRI